MNFQIRNRWTGDVQFECELSAEVAGLSYGLQLGFAVKQALASGSNLRGADLGDADLSGSNLSGSNLRGADLSGADLGGADLGDADLRGSNLSGSNLSGSNLRGADLGDADLSGSNLSGADLGGADLGDADLRDANLTSIRDDVFAVLSSAPAEAYGVRDALLAGKVDGSTYTGECACLVGTIANTRQCDYSAIPGLSPNSYRPAESFFMSIRPGHTPENSQPAKIAHEWVSEWIARMEAAFGPKPEAVTP